MVIESDGVLKEALKNKLGKVIDAIPVTLKQLNITSTDKMFRLEWVKDDDA